MRRLRRSEKGGRWIEEGVKRVGMRNEDGERGSGGGDGEWWRVIAVVVESVVARLCATDSLPHTSLSSLCISLSFSFSPCRFCVWCCACVFESMLVYSY